ncbi:hypothetical protein PHELEMICH_3 [Mycobacterium phage Phelemich]|uniref:Amino acid:DNA transferase domain-containing protein n=2 Tax=Acadianvirus reprobate TaxID=1982903 RepID=S5Y7M7_9CAUD|nr:hypothetical protein N847_gp03 [Mycobacterium phage Phelemich]YP_008409924.1 hypothetical protein REPROBATE_3 [Mycobacterium phage Reprobate]AGT12739.1 hypothetical protein REPROBATE_3 [Mycobacterium phage Reprobate]AGT13917.1 hypothetical protein PHELEMICH_3 [Mycobacterium phage Phelemich]
MTIVDAPSLLADYGTWHRAQVSTGDIDPAYPVLRLVGDALGGGDALGWLVLRHVAYYHLGSALRSMQEAPGAALPDRLLKLRTGTERRGNRDVRAFRRHWDTLRADVEDHGGPVRWLRPEATGVAGWEELTQRILAVHGNGRWAAYKLCEISAKVMGNPITAPDAGHAHSTGPRKGLARLFGAIEGNTPSVIALLDRQTAELAAWLGEPDIAQVETSLCDFNSGCCGRYYIGKDIDEQQEHLLAVPSDLTAVAFSARAGAFASKYRGEVGGWVGIDKARCRVYRDSGRIVTR